MAFTAVAALVTAETVTVGMVLAAVAEVGVAMTVVGAVTGSEDLMKIGGALGIVGGVGGMINGALGGAAASATEAAYSGWGAAGQAEVAAGAGAADLGSITSNIGAGAADATMAAALPGDFGFDASALASPNAPVSSPVVEASGASEAVKAPADKLTVGSNADAPLGATEQRLGNAANTTDRIASATNVNTPAGTTGDFARMDGAGYRSEPFSSGSMFGKLGDWWGGLNSQDRNNYLKVGGSVLQGAQQAKMFDERMGLEKQRLQQTSYGSAIPKGIINSARAA